MKKAIIIAIIASIIMIAGILALESIMERRSDTKPIKASVQAEGDVDEYWAFDMAKLSVNEITLKNPILFELTSPNVIKDNINHYKGRHVRYWGHFLYTYETLFYSGDPSDKKTNWIRFITSNDDCAHNYVHITSTVALDKLCNIKRNDRIMVFGEVRANKEGYHIIVYDLARMK